MFGPIEIGLFHRFHSQQIGVIRGDLILSISLQKIAAEHTSTLVLQAGLNCCILVK
jgi:hypothetical protein